MSNKIYKNSPLKEAVFDIRLKYKTQPDFDFPAIEAELKSDYPERTYINAGKVVFKISEKADVNSTQKRIGIRLNSIDGTMVSQFHEKGLTFSKLKPYEGWEKFFSEASRIYKILLDKTDVEYIERIALRFINEIEIPEKIFELSDYFETYPKIPSAIDDGIEEFFTRTVVNFPEDQIKSIITQTTDTQNTQDKVTKIILDIDVFKSGLRILPNSKKFDEAVEKIKTIRTKIFESSITKKTKDLIR